MSLTTAPTRTAPMPLRASAGPSPPLKPILSAVPYWYRLVSTPSRRVPGKFGASIQVHRPGRPIVIQGPGDPSQVTLVQHVQGQTLMSVHTDSTVVQHLTFDCQSYQGGTCFGVGSAVVNGQLVGGNDTILYNCTALGSSGNKAFTLYYRAPPTATEKSPVYNVGNRIVGCTVHDEIPDDGISFLSRAGA